MLAHAFRRTALDTKELLCRRLPYAGSDHLYTDNMEKLTSTIERETGDRVNALKALPGAQRSLASARSSVRAPYSAPLPAPKRSAWPLPRRKSRPLRHGCNVEGRNDESDRRNPVPEWDKRRDKLGQRLGQMEAKILLSIDKNPSPHKICHQTPLKPLVFMVQTPLRHQLRQVCSQ